MNQTATEAEARRAKAWAEFMADAERRDGPIPPDLMHEADRLLTELGVVREKGARS